MRDNIYKVSVIDHATGEVENLIFSTHLADVSEVVAARTDKLEGDVLGVLRNLSPRLYPRVSYDLGVNVELQVEVR